MTGTGARVLTAIVLIPLVVSLVLWGPTWLVAVVVAGIILVALHEFFAIGAKMNMPGYPRFTMLCALGVVWAMAYQAHWYFREIRPFPKPLTSLLGWHEFYLTILLIGCAGFALASRRGVAEALPSCAVSAAGFLFIAWPLSHLVRLHSIRPFLVLFTLVVVWVGDSAAFFVGRSMGRHLLAPTISPKKTWEGAVANVLGSLLAGFAFFQWLHLSLVHCLTVAVLVSVAGQMGDLFESVWKRGAGVKDSGSILPGHGGILDRIDALLLAVPVVWWYFLIFHWEG